MPLLRHTRAQLGRMQTTTSRRKSKQICELQLCGKGFQRTPAFREESQNKFANPKFAERWDTQTETVTTGTRLRPHTEASRFIIQRRKTSSSEGTSIRSTIESTMLMSCPTQHTQKMTIPDKPKDMMTWKIQKLLKPRHPAQSNESARPKQQLSPSTQTRLRTSNHTGWH